MGYVYVPPTPALPREGESLERPTEDDLKRIPSPLAGEGRGGGESRGSAALEPFIETSTRPA